LECKLQHQIATNVRRERQLKVPDNIYIAGFISLAPSIGLFLNSIHFGIWKHPSLKNLIRRKRDTFWPR